MTPLATFVFWIIVIIVLISAYLLFVKHYSARQLIDTAEQPFKWIMTPFGPKATPTTVPDAPAAPSGAAPSGAAPVVITSPTTGKPVVVVPTATPPPPEVVTPPSKATVTTAAGTQYTRVGCFHDAAQQTGSRTMPYMLADLNPWDAGKCNAAAKAQGYKYFARQYGTQCWAGNDHGTVPATNCNFQGGDGAWANEVYQTS